MKIKEKIQSLLPSYRIGKISMKEMTERADGIYCRLNAIESELSNFEDKNEYLFWLSQMRDGETMAETKKRVFLNMPKATGELRMIQLAENYILQKVKNICDRNNLNLFLVAGTLLGAVRHHGFIPWDDDIDVFMFREDANKLIELLANDEEIRANRYYLRSGTAFIKVKYTFSDSFFIDIFTLDYMECKNDIEAKRLWDETQIVAKTFNQRILKLFNDLNWTPCKNRPETNSAIDVQVEAIYEDCVENLTYYGHGNYICQSIHDGYVFRIPAGIFPKEDAFPIMKNELEFENQKYDTMKNYLDRLNYQYGDIWTLPNRIKPHHLNEIIDKMSDDINELKTKSII